MSTNTAKSPDALFARFAKAFNDGSVNQLAECFAPDAVLQHPMFGRVEGRDNILAAETGLFEAFTDINFEVRRVLRGVDWHAAHYLVRARQCRDINLPNGDKLVNRDTTIELVGADIFQLGADGLIVEAHRYLDTGAMFAALGAGTNLTARALNPSALGVSEGTPPAADALVSAIKSAYEQSDITAVADCYTADGVLIHPMAGELVGRTAIAAVEGMLVNCFSDIEFRVERVVQDGWWAVAELTISATHSTALPTPDGGQIAATGRRVTDPVVQVFRLSPDCRMAYAERIFDTAGLVRQLLG